MLMCVSVFDQIGSKSCCLDSVLHLHPAMGRKWSTVVSSSETTFWPLQEHMVEKPAVYSKLLWIWKCGKSDSSTLVLIVINCSGVFAFNTLAVGFIRVSLLELVFCRCGVHFQKYFCPLWQGLSYRCVQCMARTCSAGCSYFSLMSISPHVVCPLTLSQQNSFVKNIHRSGNNVVALCCHPSITLDVNSNYFLAQRGCKFNES